MDSQPIVRRRPRKTTEPARRNGRKLPLHSDSTIVLVSDHPDLFAPLLKRKRASRVWRAEGQPSRGQFSGDPTDPFSYRFFLKDNIDVTAIVALDDAEFARAVVECLHTLRPDIAFLVVGAGSTLDAREDLILRSLDWSGVVDASIERELKTAATLRRVNELRAFADAARVVPIVMHQDPDPDALASALALRFLLRRRASAAPVVTLDEMTRPENRRMADLLNIQVTQVTGDELRGFERLICVDTQPRSLTEGPMPLVAVIDHHPVEPGYEADYCDIRPEYGATATIVTEYMRAADERLIGNRLATGLVYAIKTDTDNLTRGVTAADIEAYSFLLERADEPLLRQIERPAYSASTACAYGTALAGLVAQDDLAVAYLGKLDVDDSHILADVADFLLGLEAVTWSAAAAIVAGRLIITLRHLGGENGAGMLAQRLADGNGVGGGHDTMARAVLNLSGEWSAITGAKDSDACRMLLKRIGPEVEKLRS